MLARPQSSNGTTISSVGGFEAFSNGVHLLSFSYTGMGSGLKYKQHILYFVVAGRPAFLSICMAQGELLFVG